MPVQSESISEQDLRDVYEAQLERSGDTQYRIEIIGYNEQAQALQAIQRLRDGELTVSELKAEADAQGFESRSRAGSIAVRYRRICEFAGRDLDGRGGIEAAAE